MPAGRPPTFTDREKVAGIILERISQGMSLGKACETKAEIDLPSPLTFYRWIDEDEGLRSRYASAREQQAERFAEELVEIADKAEHEESNALVQAARLRIDTRKWVAAKLLPKKYGDFQRTEITGELDVKLTDEQLESRLAQLLRKAGVTAPAGGAGPQGKS